MNSGVVGEVAAEKFTAPLPPIRGANWHSVGWRGPVCTVCIFGEIGIGSQSVQELLQTIGTARAVEFLISSCGGDSSAAMKLYTATRGRATVATIRGQCFSAACIVAAAANCIRIESNARMMVHRARVACFGDEDHLLQAVKCLRSVNHFYQQALAQRGCETDKWFDGADHYFTANEAKAAGLVDDIFTDTPADLPPTGSTKEAAQPEPSETEDEAMFNEILRAFGPVRVGDRNKFAQATAAWAFHNSIQTNTHENYE